MVDIFQEVEEDLRAERMRRLAVRYGAAAVGVLVLIVGGTGAWQGWQWWQAKQSAESAELYMKAMEDTQRQRGRTGAAGLGAAVADLDHLSRTAAGGYRPLASLNAAALRAERSDDSGALETWDRAANDPKTSPELRQLAILMWAAHQIDKGDPGQIRSRLQPLTAAASPWTPLAKELMAVLDLREGKQDLARDELRRATSSSLVPTGMSGRAASILARLGG